MIVFIFLVFAVAALIYTYLVWNFSYWAKRRVQSPKARVLLGNLPNGILRNKNVVYDFEKIYKRYKGKVPFVGLVQLRDPRLMILEPELIKDVLVRKFHHFRNNEFSYLIDTELDPLFAKNPFLLRDDEWKEKRAEITPAFTTNRLKALYPLIQDVSVRMVKYINTEVKKADPFDARELSAKFTTDVVSNCIFGIDAESFTKEKPEIREMGRRLFSQSAWIFVKMIILESFKFLQGFIKIQFTELEVQQFFVDLMKQALKYREEKKVQREDFLDFVIQLRNKKNISELEMASHTISFFSDGFETSSIAISHALYEIAKNKRVQAKLREEVRSNLDKNGQISFEKLQEMTYLDQVFHEALRMHPPLMITSRLCSEDVELEYDGKKVTVEKGMNVFIPYLWVHYDPENFLEPTNFHPERFDDGALKDYLDRCVLMPFGGGPRICLGMRFALLQSKAALATVIANFEISVNSKTQDSPLVIDPIEFLNIKTGGLWLDFKPLSDE
ncbi:probable cytochrome P450 28a5 [Chironomus tepperi]|uniref:probable cytochrome P450 28a5 n=1 Tax=Chironomus tepperi TaxID=113505 RepID=UPI00391FACA9